MPFNFKSTRNEKKKKKEKKKRSLNEVIRQKGKSLPPITV